MSVTDDYVREANKKRMAVDIARAINEREAKRDAMTRRATLRVAMVERHRAARRELQGKQDERWIEEVKERAERFRKGLLGLWDRLTGKHSELRHQNEAETITCAERDAGEKQALIDRQLAERQRLQREIIQTRRIHLHEVTRLHRQIATYRRMDGNVAIETGYTRAELDAPRRQRKRDISDP